MLVVPVAVVLNVATSPGQAGKFTGCDVMVSPTGVVTVKSETLVAVLPATVTVIFPVDASDGIVVVMLVEVLAVTVAAVPLKFTVLADGVLLKFVPVMVTVVPTGPEVGVNEVIVGTGAAPTIKFVADCTVTQFTVTEILPVTDEAGTVVLMVVVVLPLTVAARLLKKVTALLAGVVLKFVPVITTGVPMGPVVGVNEVIVGGRETVPNLIF